MLASQFFAIIKMANFMAEEFKEEHSEEFEGNKQTRDALAKGFTSYKSAETDYFLEHN
jgi:hypothetical protein